MNTQSAGLEVGVYEAWDSLMVVMEECGAPAGRHRGCGEQIPWQRWMEFTRQPSIHLYTTLRRRTGGFWFQMMERPGALSITEQQNYSCWNDSRETQCWVWGTCPRPPKEKPSTHIELNLSSRYSRASAVSVSVLTLLLLLWEQPLTKTAEQLGAALLMWDGGHFSVSSQLGMEEDMNQRESTTPLCTCRYLSAQRRPQTN